MLFDTVVLDGEIELILDGSAECCLEVPECGEYGETITVNKGALPAYTGPTEIIPNEDHQTLETANKSVLENITIAPIPSNYGLITWNGRTLTVS